MSKAVAIEPRVGITEFQLDEWALAKLERARWEKREEELRQQLLAAWPAGETVLHVGAYRVTRSVRRVLSQAEHKKLAAYVAPELVETLVKVKLGEVDRAALADPAAQELFDKSAVSALRLTLEEDEA